MQMQNIANIAVFESLLIVAIAEECESHAACADGGLDSIGNVSGIRERIHVFHALAAVFRMSFKVIIGAACNAQSSPQPNGKRYSISVVPLE